MPRPMDVQLIASGVLDLPSSQRVGALVHDGTTDLRLWRPPGPDRDLLQHYGDELISVLDRERQRRPEGLEIGEMLRLHRGRLHCDFLLWIATRPAETQGVQAKAPSAAVLSQAVVDALAFAAERSVERVAFGAIGAGPDALDDIDRVVLIGRAANAYSEACYAQGRPAQIEEVLVCHPHSSKITAARRQLGGLVNVLNNAPPPAPGPTRRRTGTERKTAPRKTSTRKAKAAQPTLSAAEIGHARATAGPYDRSLTYAPGDYFVHSKFGVGRVESLTPEGFIMVLFDHGVTKRLLHNRA